MPPSNADTGSSKQIKTSNKMDTMNDLFDIRILTSAEGVPFEVENEGTIYVVGDPSSLSDKISAIEDAVIGGMDSYNSCNSYRISIVRQRDNFKEDFGWNIICPIEDPASSTRLYIIASSADKNIEMAVPAVINEADGQMRRFMEEALIKAAIKDPDGFRSAVDRAIGDPGDDGGGVSAPDKGEPYDGCDVCCDRLTERDILDMCVVYSIMPMPSHCEAAVGQSRHSRVNHRRGMVSAKDRKAAFTNLPERISEAYMKDNAMYAEIVDDTFATYSADELRALIRELGKKYKNLYRNAYDTTLQSVTKYELVLHPWSERYSREFRKRNNYRYYLYLKDSKGRERPVIFKHNPSFCIYVMYMVDRYNRKEDVTDLSIKTMEKEFRTVYKAIMDETDKKIGELFGGMCHRKSKNGNSREGRYGEYIKDIHQTFEDLMGNINSIPFKVGFGRYLQVPPEKMALPENLAKLRII